MHGQQNIKLREYYLSSIQPGSGAHPTSCPVDTGHSFAGLKRPGRESDHLATIYCNGLQNREDMSPLPNVFMPGTLQKYVCYSG